MFRYPRLPHLLTTARGNGVQLLLAYHDIAQIEHLFGGRDVARTILSNAKLRVLLPGVGDVETLRYFSELLGQTKVSVGARTDRPGRPAVTHRSRPSRSPGARCTCSSSCRPGRRVLLYENLPPVPGQAPALVRGPGPLRLTHGDAPDLPMTATVATANDRDRQPGDRRAARCRLRPRAGRDRSPPPRTARQAHRGSSRISADGAGMDPQAGTAHAGRSSGHRLTGAELDAPGRALADWVGWLRGRYPLAHQVPLCWWRHPELVEELTALWLAWRDAYVERGAPLTAGADWHGRCLPELLRRIGAGGWNIACEGEHRDSVESLYDARQVDAPDEFAGRIGAPRTSEPPITGGEVMDVEEMKAALRAGAATASGRTSGLAGRAAR